MKRKYVFTIGTPQASLRTAATGSFAPPRMQLRLPVRMGGLGLLTLALSLPHAHAEPKTSADLVTSNFLAVNPLFPASGPAQRLFQEPPASLTPI